MSILTSPTTTILARSLHNLATCSKISPLSFEPTVNSTASMPIPSVNSSILYFKSGSFGKHEIFAPFLIDKSIFLLSKSKPQILNPLALQICTLSCPTKPRPTIRTEDPICWFACLIPCIAIVPNVEYTAFSSLTVFGIFTHKFFGTETTSE